MNNVTITIEYKFSNSEKWCSIELSPDKYFDLDPDEKVEWDCVPVYDHAIDYLDIDKNLVQYTKNTIIDSEVNLTSITTETFWNKGQNRIVESSIVGSISWWETIIEIKLEGKSPTWEILKYTKENNFPKLSYHGFFIDHDDGSQEEKIIYKK